MGFVNSGIRSTHTHSRARASATCTHSLVAVSNQIHFSSKLVSVFCHTYHLTRAKAIFSLCSNGLKMHEPRTISECWLSHEYTLYMHIQFPIKCENVQISNEEINVTIKYIIFIVDIHIHTKAALFFDIFTISDTHSQKNTCCTVNYTIHPYVYWCSFWFTKKYRPHLQ